MTEQNDVRLAAYHEAGHAVVAHCIGWKVEEMVLQVSRDGSLLNSWTTASAQTRIRAFKETRDGAFRRLSEEELELQAGRQNARNDMMFLLAGDLAVRMVTGKKGSLTAVPEEVYQAIQLASALSKDWIPGFRRAQRRVLSILHANWHSIEALAAELLQQKHVSAERLGEIVEAPRSKRAKTAPLPKRGGLRSSSSKLGNGLRLLGG